MRKLMIFFVLAAFLCIPALVLANETTGFNPDSQQSRGGYTGPVATQTVQQVLEMRDDVPVIMEGKIVRFLGGERYEFVDKTGGVTIEIDDDYNWEGQSVGPDDTVVIYGEVDRDFKDFKVDVDRVIKK